MKANEKEKALQDILAIRSTIDQVSGASLFKDYIYSMGSMLIIFGVLFIFAIGVTWYLNTQSIENTKIIVTVIWTLLLGSGSIIKTTIFHRRGKIHGMSFHQYLKRVLNRSFFGIDIPLEYGGMILIIYFIKIGQSEMLLPLITLFTGMLFGNLGFVFNEKSLRIFGYVFLSAAAVGFLLPNINYYIYSLFSFGVLYVLWGLILHNKSRKDDYIAEESDED